MGSKETERPLNLFAYTPLTSEDVEFIAEAPVPPREFNPSEGARWSASLTPTGVIVINLVHKRYPDAVCQVQCAQDEGEQWHMFFYHLSETYDFIPDEMAEVLALEVFPQVMESLQEGPAN